MSTPVAAVIVLAALIVVLPTAHRIILRRNRAFDAKRDQIIREANARVGLTPPAADNWPGVNAAVQDACELIWDMDAYDPELNAGCDRLRGAINEHRKENPS